MNRCYTIQDGEIKYSCAERNFQKAESFGLDYLDGDWIVVIAESIEKALEKYNEKLKENNHA